MTELKSYVESLDNYDEKHPDIQKFMSKLDRHIDYKALLANFEWTNSYFEKLDDLLVMLSYQLQDTIIEEIRKFLQEKIRATPITTFNHIFRSAIWNHYMYICHYQYYQGRENLSMNPEIIDILKENPQLICWPTLSNNPAAIDLLKMNLDMIDWYYLSSNPAAIELIQKYPHRVSWGELSRNTNPDAIKMLRKNPANISWRYLSENKCPDAIQLLRENPDKIDWQSLSCNSAPEAIKLLKENPEKIYWINIMLNPAASEIINEYILSRNIKKYPGLMSWSAISKNPATISILEAYPHQIRWYELSLNPGACKLLKANLNLVMWDKLSENPGATEIIRDNLNKVEWRALSKNHYNYYSEKLNYFNGLKFFPRSRLCL